MQHETMIWSDPVSHVTRHQPDHPVLYLCPQELARSANRFQSGFDGLVTYAVKANGRADILGCLSAAGIATFDVASPVEIDAVRRIAPGADLHYNNPVRSPAEIAHGLEAGVVSWSVDHPEELSKLDAVPSGSEISVRFKLPMRGAAYDFGEKFGATPDQAAELLARVAQSGRVPSLCFHPGTQCDDATAWRDHIVEAARIAAQAGIRIARLNVGGGFAAHRETCPPDLERVFDTIRDTTCRAFGPSAPQLLCEPGRAMVASAGLLATRIKGHRDGDTLYLNDGIYGALADLRDMGAPTRYQLIRPDGRARNGAASPWRVFGPTCDSLDRLPGRMVLPEDLEVGDYILFPAMGAYSVAMSTRFNGFGTSDVVTVRSMAGHIAP